MRRYSLLLLALAGLLVQLPAAARQTEPPDFSPAGLQPKRAYFGELPFEQIDMVNGNLILTFTDLVLPGNAGMDLVLQRTYNRQGTGWHFGLAGVPMQVANPEAPFPEGPDESRLHPGMIMADGSVHPTMPLNGPGETDEWTTDRFWRYTLADRRVHLPNGRVAQYSVHTGWALLESVTDRFGNTIGVTWDTANPSFPTIRRPTGLSQTVGPDSRHVTFTYAQDWLTFPETMTLHGDGDRTWTYGFQFDPGGAWHVTSVQPPAGAPWQFDYSGGLRVTTPAGGTVHYEFQDQVFPDEPGVPRKVVATRTLGGRDVTGAAWTFHYQPQDPTQDGSFGTADGPAGLSLQYRHDWTSQRWMLSRKTIRQDGQEIAAIAREYRFLHYLPWATGSGSVPVIERDTITQDGRTYSTLYEYDEQRHFGDWHRPFRITESGDLERVTERVFDYDFSF